MNEKTQPEPSRSLRHDMILVFIGGLFGVAASATGAALTPYFESLLNPPVPHLIGTANLTVTTDHDAVLAPGVSIRLSHNSQSKDFASFIVNGVPLDVPAGRMAVANGVQGKSCVLFVKPTEHTTVVDIEAACFDSSD